eukprot:CAMPEP_0114321150 /NCGR_PEP_ID=MMETSP0059-20121206/26406_1 /TAXON_ID=36894 /ORGANISM="Pyramimonas parkeae, Strain CCMP726" /LENGTH=53 /DNA_ID=CAMNT_0001448775 /DNA_START=137 /DNA_END=294 /DNA_ORIENTATION=-
MSRKQNSRVRSIQDTEMVRFHINSYMKNQNATASQYSIQQVRLQVRSPSSPET